VYAKYQMLHQYFFFYIFRICFLLGATQVLAQWNGQWQSCFKTQIQWPKLATVIGSRKNIEESDIGQLPYLQAVVKETFRLHPSVPLLLRRAPVDTKIMGYTIPKGCRMFINVRAVGRDKETWPEPEKFMPERFLGKRWGL
jgi:cytochrome P450